MTLPVRFRKNNCSFHYLRNYVSFILLSCLLAVSSNANAQFTITETFRGSSVPQEIILGNQAGLTTQSGIDAPGNGWLRLTNYTQTYSLGYCYINQSFPSSLGVLAEFEFKAWRSGTIPLADGFCVFLFDAAYGPTPGAFQFAPGNVGGSLGYAYSQANTNGGDFEPALTGGYIGVGFDEFGTWSTTYQGQVGSLKGDTQYGAVPNAIAIRGSVPNTPFLTGTQADLAGTVYSGLKFAYQPSTTTRPPSSGYYRKVQVLLEKNAQQNYEVSVKMQIDSTGLMQTVFGPYILTEPPPANLKLGFTASNGLATANHEIRNLRITTPGGVRVEKATEPISVANGSSYKYMINVYNDSPNPLTNIAFTDNLPAGFQYNSISFNNGGNASNTFDAGSTVIAGNVLTNNTLSLAARSYGVLTINGRLNVADSTTTQLQNTVIVKSPPGFSDPDPTNDTARVITYRVPLLSNVNAVVCSTLLQMSN